MTWKKLDGPIDSKEFPLLLFAKSGDSTRMYKYGYDVDNLFYDRGKDKWFRMTSYMTACCEFDGVVMHYMTYPKPPSE